MVAREVRLLLWLVAIHLVGVYLFTKGFLLNRLALPDASACANNACASLATHKRAVLIVIDALRFDFISEHPPEPVSPYHHNVLTLPRELTAAHPERSFIFNAYSDPPTTTLQRLKGITTGSLPTFVDSGSSFGGAAVHEDSIIHQLKRAGRKVALAGDDTWLTLFPDAFDPHVLFPYDSFNVEDLHTVDEGVISHILPLMRNHSQSWDFAIGHGLGVDHTGHRVGPDHPIMKTKLKQWNDFLTEVVRELDDDTLLVLLGDHGMDRTGNHGGDSVLETLSGLWIYSKSIPLSTESTTISESILPTTIFPGAKVPHRFIQQIDLLPTLSLLLGLPIPFNNLGTIIPELFNRDTAVQTAIELNAGQIRRYLDTYRASSFGRELDTAWGKLQTAWGAVEAASTQERVSALYDYNRLVLSSCRILWAQFNLTLMGFGLVVIALGVVASWALYSRSGDSGGQWAGWQDETWRRCFRGVIAGAAAAGVMYFPLRSYLEGVDLHQIALFGSALFSGVAIVAATRPSLPFSSLKSVPLPLILHVLCFASNSFVVWEDRVVLFLLLSCVLPSVLAGFTAPTRRLRVRILGFSALFAVCVRLMALSTVCREEQHPSCTVTFYTSATSSVPPVLALLLALPVSFALPRVIRRVLGISKSDKGLAAVFLPWFLTPGLVAGSVLWILEWMDSARMFGEGAVWLRSLRTILARMAFAVMLLGSLTLWWKSPLCLEISRSSEDKEGNGVGNGNSDKDNETKGKATQVTVLGFANAFGSPYLIFWTVFLSVVWLTTQLAGQVILGLATVALLAHLEVVDSLRDARGLNDAFSSGNPSAALDLNLSTINRDVVFSEIVPLALLAIHTFYGTGHQSTLPSLQWKTAFILTPTLAFPFSHFTALLNTLGPHIVLGLAAPLLTLWNLSPIPPPSLSPRAGLGMMIYFGTLLLGTAGCAAALRRHLMVWKIFAPRYMFASVSLGVVDMGVVLGVWVGVGRVKERVERVFKAIG
ncbi:hypothetical protein BV22DRAFT_1063942 [Leucogyrophana mollusca]|uniref:Uncharacterized protein n=1 Tax=Leucogyrophana mollusca TaxID=85980 RepID=A0ACB8BKV8_9AGAM|nr:hypothetical protein BV22DRAFT_1063942 [Leucogyrophana mollusca]